MSNCNETLGLKFQVSFHNNTEEGKRELYITVVQCTRRREREPRIFRARGLHTQENTRVALIAAAV